MSDPRRWRELEDDKEMQAMLTAGVDAPAMPETTRQRLGVYVSSFATGTTILGTLFATKTVAAAVLLVGATAAVWTAQHFSSVPSAPESRFSGKRSKTVVRETTQDSEKVTPVPSLKATERRSVTTHQGEPARAQPISASGAASVDDESADIEIAPERRDAVNSRDPENVISHQRVADARHHQGESQVENSLLEEADLLENARHFLRSSPQKAWPLILRHEEQFPTGQLVSEREVIAIDILVQLGRRQEAVERGEAFLEKHPEGIYARRILSLIEVRE